MPVTSDAEPVAAAPRVPRGLSFRAKLVASICALVLVTGGGIMWLNFESNKRTTAALTDELFREVSSHAVTSTLDFVLRASRLVESLAALGNDGLDLEDSDRAARQFAAVLQANPALSWIHFADPAGRFTGVYRTPEGALRSNQSWIDHNATRLVEHDVLPDGSWVVHRQESDTGYDPRTRPYYQKAVESGRLVWLKPYVFYEQGVPGVTCAAPLYGADGGIRGVISADFDLNALSGFMAGMKVSEHSQVFLFTDDHVLLAHPHTRVTTRAGQRGQGTLLTLADAGDPLVDAFRSALNNAAVKSDLSGRFVSFQFEHAGELYFASATRFNVGDDLQWVVGAVAPARDFLAGVWTSQRLALATAVVGLLASVLLAGALARRVSGPVRLLIDFMNRVGAGDLDIHADIRGSRDFQQLSNALNAMITDLRDRARLRHSLHVAMEVQQQLLPAQPPQVKGLDLAGHSTYCDETGGDYYDFLVLEASAPDQMLVVLGDVMGHGVAAALIMAGARSVLRDRAAESGSLADLLKRLNQLLASDLGGSRFMTMYVGIIDLRRRTLRWASAGHDPALIFQPATGAIEERDEGDLPLGVDSGAEFVEYAFHPLERGQVFVIGTDGIWEARNAAQEQFGKDRLRRAICATALEPAQRIRDRILDDLRAFCGSVRPADDVTFVVIKVTDHV
jgi:sigma-B regulation protein RsbU (phosphoserine phosphatase)